MEGFPTIISVSWICEAEIFAEKHQDWDDLRRAVDEVGHLGRDAFVQRVQIRGEPGGHHEQGDRDDKNDDLGCSHK